MSESLHNDNDPYDNDSGEDEEECRVCRGPAEEGYECFVYVTVFYRLRNYSSNVVSFFPVDHYIIHVFVLVRLA